MRKQAGFSQKTLYPRWSYSRLSTNSKGTVPLAPRRGHALKVKHFAQLQMIYAVCAVPRCGKSFLFSIARLATIVRLKVGIPIGVAVFTHGTEREDLEDAKIFVDHPSTITIRGRPRQWTCADRVSRRGHLRPWLAQLHQRE
jgi:hypothetical protein